MRINRTAAVVLVLAIAIVVGAFSWFRVRDAAADLMGDANCDGTVNAIDGAVILQYAAGFSIDFDCPSKVDVNGDGRIDSIDAALVLQYTAGLIDDLDLGPAVTATRTRTRTPTRTPTIPLASPTATTTPEVSALECQLAASNAVAEVRAYAFQNATLQDIRNAALDAWQLCSDSPLVDCASVLSEGVLILPGETSTWARSVVDTCDIPAV